ncbi:MAG: hypothetical protein NZM35_10935, partial [Chitinophagales bacterium]|nr:hypothetical protein [Chitinophagales bacterium]
ACYGVRCRFRRARILFVFSMVRARPLRFARALRIPHPKEGIGPGDLVTSYYYFPIYKDALTVSIEHLLICSNYIKTSDNSCYYIATKNKFFLYIFGNTIK